MSRTIELTIDDRAIEVREGATLLEACRQAGVEVPTLCYAENLTPVNVCRLCVVEVEGARVLAPACSRGAEAGMKVRTGSERVRLARKVVLELLGSSVDLSRAPELGRLMAEYGAVPSRFGPPISVRAESEEEGEHHHAEAGHHHAEAGHHGAPSVDPERGLAATRAEAPTIDNELYVRDYARCVLCYKCVEACGADAQNTFAIAVAGRGFDARISTELGVPLPASACVYCGNCIGVCPTAALVPRAEWELRQAGRWDESRQARTDTICPYCGVGCAVTLHVQDERIVKVTSPIESTVTNGHLCIKGRFGFEFVQLRTDRGRTAR